jgi:lipopolysaccharide exporter
LNGTSTLGLYSVAADLAVLFTKELVLPLGRGMLPSLAKVKTQPELLKEVYGNTIALTALILLPAGFGLSSLAENLIPVILGSQWIDAIPLLVWLSLYGAMAGILHTLGGQVQVVTGHEHIAAMLSWIRVLLLLVFVTLFSNLWGVQGAAAGALLSTLVALPIVASQLKKSVGIGFRDLGLISWRPLVASILMFFSLRHLDIQSVVQNDYSALAFKCLTGLFIYSVSVFVLWSLSGRPDGIERILYDRISGGVS